MDGLLVLKEETVATSLAGLVCDPSTFIVEEYSEEVTECTAAMMPPLGRGLQGCRGDEHCSRGVH